MTLQEIQTILDAKLLCGEELMSHEVRTACGSDMMSDVLAYVKDQAVLLTGLMNQQVVRTAEMMDMICVIFVRDKAPDEGILTLARQKGIAIMTTHHRMFTSCGLLYQAGLKGGLHQHEL
ncbi:MAG: DRTGG domain-containing protein [Angelakisella sp.]